MPHWRQSAAGSLSAEAVLTLHLFVNILQYARDIVSYSLSCGFVMQGGWLAHDFLHHQVFRHRSFNTVAGYFIGNVALVASPPSCLANCSPSTMASVR